MSIPKNALLQIFVENPEVACDCIEAISSALSDKTKTAIKDKAGRTCKFIGSQLAKILPASQGSEKLSRREVEHKQIQGKGYASSKLPHKEDYGNQLEAFMPMTEIVYEMSSSLELVWEKGNKESCYVSSFAEDDTEYDCQIFLGDNSRAILEVDVYNDDELEYSFSIGRDLYPIHPVLNKKLSDLFFIVEDAVLNNKYAEASQEDTSLDSLPASHKKILIFLEQVTNLTEKKS